MNYPKLLLVLLISTSAFSQGKVEPTPEDLEIANVLKTEFPDDEVALISSVDLITFDFDKKNMQVTVKQITDEEMINLDSRADIQKYCFYDGESEITEFEISYINGKKAGFQINDEAYKSDDLFHNDSRVQYADMDFPLNAYRYLTHVKKEYKDVKYFTSLYFNDDYPIQKKTISVTIPDWLNLELKEMNFEGHDIEKTLTTEAENHTKTHTYTLNNVPAMYQESNAPGPSYIYPHLLILAKSYTRDDTSVTLFDATKDLYGWYISLVNSLQNDNSALQAKVNELTESAKTDDEKIKNIYYWVQDNIRYIAFLDGIAGFKPDEAANVFNKRYGDCKGMANLTKQMLLEAGFDARLTWIGTKHIAYDYSTPNLAIDNHMICTLFKDGNTLFLDATEKFNALGEYADRIQGKQVLIENGEDFILQYVPQAKASFNKETLSYNLTLEEDHIIGSVDRHYNGESRSQLLQNFHTLKTENKAEFLEFYLNQGNSNIAVSNIDTTNLLNRDQNIDIAYDVAIKNAVSSFDGQIYIDLDFDKELATHKMEKRKTDFIFSSKKDLESVTRLQIPSGYKVSHVPANISISSDNYDMQVMFKKEDRALVYKKQFRIKNAKVATSDFEQWNQFIDQLNALYNDQIILSKD
ncbi:transglutaminase domain-containing protein [Subsaximicrobium wynnwilliamsii]|uniref:Transglutaminase domain-containing protein n=1 Tax=Subsaximicrobium wynnwilliamsii TaxID=291179 RepID=A0A5C6ZJG4_9FLAO|nr:transglutaminase-like domain-containing protein [Subsaximicrobium wynnwilliamsii]TXD83036.1 transglutaminase domain-containing protein [Subsaximicrobium wynnwilliamsii]TXD88780.1 transglutaminase domain-containing protein [Subsaximicrobium wynnwilliamsii]TXE02853.1 transglutaminase domain-containing protein [Subsaximicrobium wynnwilliamsii]